MLPLPQSTGLRTFRQVADGRGASQARLLTSPPSWARTGRGRGAKAAGRRFERSLGKSLKKFSSNYSSAVLYGVLTLHSGPWIEYVLAGETKFCQPDFLIEVPRFNKILLIEAKLTRCADGLKQLVNLYKPLAQIIWPEREIILCQAFSNWAGGETEYLTRISQLFASSAPYNDLFWKPDHDPSAG